MSEYFRRHIKKEHYPVHPSTIRFKTLFKNCILDALKKRQWKDTDHDIEWDIYWAEKEWIHEIMDHIHLNNTQKVNHFRNHYELTRKDLMIKNLKRHKKNLEKEGKLDEAASYSFFPLTYNLPGEYSIFCEEFKKNTGVWIMKPISKSQGKGIFLFNKLSQIAQWKNDFRWKPDSPQSDPYIVQKYINNPLIIGGKKFDMRIYCLVTSYSPLVVYLYRTGFARFTHHRYDNDDISNAYVHLTNVAIQKTSENYDDKIGGKWELRTLKLYLMSKYGQEKVSESFTNIQMLIIKALQSVQKIIINDKHCFELYGFDVLLDSNLKPWLLEVNASPSMTANTQHDTELKINLLDDVFTIIDMEKIMTGQEEQIGGFDLIYKGNPIKLPSSSTYSTLLGCYNNRSQQLKKLAKSTAVRLAQVQTQEDNRKKVTVTRDKDTYSSTSDTSNSAKMKGKALIAPPPVPKTNPATVKSKISTNIPIYKPPTSIPAASSTSQGQPTGLLNAPSNSIPRDPNRSLKPKPRDNSKTKSIINPPVSQNGIALPSSAGSNMGMTSYAHQNLAKQNSFSNQGQKNPIPSQINQVSLKKIAPGAEGISSTLANSGMLTLTDPIKFKNIHSILSNDKDGLLESIGSEADKNSKAYTPKMSQSNEVYKNQGYSTEINSINNIMNSGSKERKGSTDDFDAKESKDIEDNLLNQPDSDDGLAKNNEE